MIKTLTRNTTKAHRTAPTRQIQIDYPLEGELLTCPYYTLRISASPEAQGVEVQLNGGEWSPCREAMGFWWFDWSGFSDGAMQARARALTPEGTIGETPVRRFKVRL